ncbi:MAG: oligosaccharide repeat unit polymerase, partial [Chitinophagaceae bacterium]|nr:oligosaccharide repeat unit polymerase [Chitinophagaceae bacterium]
KVIYRPRDLLFRINEKKQQQRFETFIKRIYKFWLFFTFFEILLFKGVPLVSVIIFKQYDLDYKAFGIPTIHGLLNACYYTCVTGFYILFVFTKEKKYRNKVILLLTWPILVMSRAVLLWVLIEILCAYLFFNKVNIKRTFIISISIVLFIIVFGLVGDSRSGESSAFSTSAFVNEKYADIAEKIPSGFVWVYLYATTPINNIVLNINNLEPAYSFKYSLNGLMPSFIRNRLFNENDKYSVVLDDDAFNVSSFFANYLHDFGIIGAIIFVGVLQMIITIFYFSATSGTLGSLISYSALFYALFTSVFFDNFISLVTLFQVILGVVINHFVYKK